MTNDTPPPLSPTSDLSTDTKSDPAPAYDTITDVVLVETLCTLVETLGARLTAAEAELAALRRRVEGHEVEWALEKGHFMGPGRRRADKAGPLGPREKVLEVRTRVAALAQTYAPKPPAHALPRRVAVSKALCGGMVMVVGFVLFVLFMLAAVNVVFFLSSGLR